jgi:hypothetical protein
MSTQIYAKEDKEFYVTRFYGGKERGVCIQLTIKNQYVQLTLDEFQQIVNNLEVRL